MIAKIIVTRYEIASKGYSSFKSVTIAKDISEMSMLEIEEQVVNLPGVAIMTTPTRKYVAENIVKSLIKAEKPVKNAKVGILGFTFKENCPDTRNTKIIDIYNELKEYGITATVADPAADADEAKHLYGMEFVDMNTITDCDAVILAVAHEQFKDLTQADFDQMFKAGDNSTKVLADIKGLLDRKEYEAAGYNYWRL